jgi:hypothetical protein
MQLKRKREQNKWLTRNAISGCTVYVCRTYTYAKIPHTVLANTIYNLYAVSQLQHLAIIYMLNVCLQFCQFIHSDLLC